MKGVCMHCGAGPDIHRYETQQCPVGGVEQSRDNYLTTVYEEDRTDPLKEQIKKLESRVTFLESKVRILAHHISLPD